VRTIPSPIAVGAGGSKESDSGLPGATARRPAGALSKVAWTPHSDMGQAEWLATGRRLGAIGRCSQWWIGDWIRYGTSRWGEKYADAARVTGYDVASLRNMAWVASQFELSLRSDNLTWSHHVLLAPLADEEKRHWLERAASERLSVADLRLELRGRQGGRGAKRGEGSETETEAEADDLVVCPNCGHELHASAE
jgi:hypothetical protein